MTLGVLTEEIFVKVNGWKPGTDSSILRADIRAMVPAAVNAAIDSAERINDQNEDEFPSDFYSVFEDVPVVWDGTSAHFMLVQKTVPLKNTDGLRSVYDGCDEYGRISDNDWASLKYYVKLAPCMKWYRRVGGRVDLYGIPPLTEKINYESITSIDDLTDDDELPIQAGFEPRVIDLLYRYFADKPVYDNVIDAKDDANASR